MSQIGNKQIMAANIRRLMERKGKDRMSVCNDLGFKYSTFSEWVNGTKYPRIDKIEIMANYFGVSKSDLIEEYSSERDNDLRGKNSIPPGFQPLPEMTAVPIIGRIACGQPITAEENIEGTTSLPSEWKADFVLICEGHSMEPKIKDGDAVAIRKVREVYNGQIAAVRIECEATLKKVYRYPDRLELRPINSDYDSIVLYGEDMNTAAIEGRAVGLCRGI